MMRGCVLLLIAVMACTSRRHPPAPAPAAVAPALPQLPLADRLAREAHARPPGAIRLEDLATALEHGGIALARSRQVLASTIGARYCGAAVTRRGVGLAVCEFDSVWSAYAGLAASRARFDPLIPGRQLLQNGKTVLTIAAGAHGLDGESKTIAELFARL